MKLKSIFRTGLALLAITVATGCQNSFDDPELTAPVATMVPNTTIAQLKETFMDTNATLCPVKDEATGEHYIIKGRVISSDATGNIYQSLMVQDATAAMPITVRRASLYNEYHLGQEVVIDVTGLWIGRYNNLMQLGWLGEPYNGQDQLTFMSFAEFQAHTQLDGNPTIDTRFIGLDSERPSDSMYCISLSIDDLADIAALSEECVMLQGQLVEFSNVSFVDGGVEIYAPYQETVNRYITGESSSKQVVVRNSGYSTFYNDILPTGTGRVRGILSWYGDGSANSSQPDVIQGWQLLLRSTDDVIFDGKGTREKPYTIPETLAFGSNGISGWTAGYIVGSIGYDGSYIFNDGADNADNNLLVAETPGITDPNLCLTLELPAGSQLREYGNLADNPVNFGKEIKVYGRFAPYAIGGKEVPGILGNPGSASYFEIEGLEIPGFTGQGTGTKTDPYTIEYVRTNWELAQTGVWTAGYIVGYVEGGSYETGVKFGLPDASADYANANIVIAPTPGCTDPSLCVPVRLTTDARKTLGLKNAPQVLGMRLLVKGGYQQYLGAPGINMNEYELPE
ncbi:MAG: hypothetical protein K2O24_02075 [Muribaculaceae bacterium]|nr:hypothetical protein [Muribaculaceae bacterium]